MRVAVTGASGLIGRRLCAYLADREHYVYRLVRKRDRAGGDDGYWNPLTGELQFPGATPPEGVVHLAGENIAAGRWTAARKAAIRDSRVAATRRFCESLARLRPTPAVLLAASAVGYYGDRGDELLTEESTPGRGFLADVARDWEAATEPACAAGIRVVNLRLGVVLAREGGVLGRLRRPFLLGLGGRIGHGRQYMSWIAREDLVRVIEFLLETNSASGPINTVAPTPVTNAHFTIALGQVLRRPTLLPVPATVISLFLGEMGRELLLASTRVVPNRLLESGFDFIYRTIESALQPELAP